MSLRSMNLAKVSHKVKCATNHMKAAATSGGINVEYKKKTCPICRKSETEICYLKKCYCANGIIYNMLSDMLLII